ncbi:erythroblast NAD(P)(+)--arginine ADP-ribosyltransferase-like [Acipenser ruthenus]|uniref:erythroblast NAD(P)(+)--arginine ADP-ribosyltransferase-like n=1 Tax=Acipenser ruthenus TaxID=7906 RepID=UPI002741219C|nr:erythroblast NAD(P)(+)--arginine ADP-ribosyltransferase-like [Acipenser ruthenus]
MDFSKHSLDDQYKGCRNKMLQKVQKVYLPRELKQNPKFNSAWSNAKSAMKSKSLGYLTLEQATAIYAYTMPGVYSDFNTAGVSKPTSVGKGKTVPFGQFTSTSRSLQKAMHFGSGTIFHMRTCQGASIQSYSMFPTEDEVLVPPFERFRVEDLKNQSWISHSPTAVY